MTDAKPQETSNQNKWEHHPNGRFNEKNYASVPNILLNMQRDGDLKPMDVLVYMAFADYVLDKSAKDSCYPSNVTLAKLLGVNSKTVERSIKNLVEHGIIGRSSERTEYNTKNTTLCLRVVKSKIQWDKPPKARLAKRVPPSPKGDEPASVLNQLIVELPVELVGDELHSALPENKAHDSNPAPNDEEMNNTEIPF